MARILITGARGFIGTHLARRLAACGHDVIGVGHGQWPPESAHRDGVVNWINGGVNATNLQLACAGGLPPERVYHLAGGSSVGVALANPREDFFKTVASTADLLEWLRTDAPRARLIAISSAAVYGAGHDGAIGEDVRLKPYSPYGHHKAMMEAMCGSYADSYGLEVVIARLFSVYGDGLRKQLLWDLCNRLSTGVPVLQIGGTGGERRDWTEVGDVARALDLIGGADDVVGTAINVGRGEGVEVREIAAHVMDIWKKESDGATTSLGLSGISRPGDPFNLVADSRRLSALGFEWQVGLYEGLTSYVRWFRRELGRSST